MALEKIIREKMVEALKAGNKEEKQVYASILTALLNKAKDIQKDLTAEQDSEVIIKLAKQNQESIDACSLDRVETLQKLKYEKDVIAQFMPKQMSDDEITNVIKDIINKMGINDITPKEKGKVMKELMPLVKGKADGKQVNKILEGILNKK